MSDTIGRISVPSPSIYKPRRGNPIGEFAVTHSIYRDYHCLNSCLRDRSTRSCGCFQHDAFIKRLPRLIQTQQERKLPAGVAAFNTLLASYQTRARKDHLEWELERETVESLFKGDCFYCGAPPTRKRYVKNGAGFFIYNGIDRVDNRLGYLTTNVVSCCTICNTCKSARPVDEFIDWACRIANRIKRREEIG